MAAIMLASAASLALFALPFAELVQEYYRDQATVTLQQHAQVAAIAVAADGNAVTTLNTDPDVRIAAYDRTGARVGGIGPSPADSVVLAALDQRPSTTRADNGDLAVGTPTAGPVAAVRVESPASVVDTKVRRAWALIVVLATAVLAVVGVGAWFLSRRLVRPVQSLTTDLARLGDGDFGVGVTRTGVTEIDGAYDALGRTAQRLGQALERERAFSADVAHQLRTPITSLQLGLEAELAAPREDPTIALHDALDEVARLETTTEDLLALARERRPPPEPVDVGDVLQALQNRWRPRFDAQRRDLALDRPDRRVLVVAHPGSLHQALDILVDNALQHGEGATSLSIASAPDHVTFRVRDSGPGVPNPTRATSAISGDAEARTPIGLNLARRLVETDGGRLRVPTGPRPTFEIILPTVETV